MDTLYYDSACARTAFLQRPPPAAPLLPWSTPDCRSARRGSSPACPAKIMRLIVSPPAVSLIQQPLTAIGGQLSSSTHTQTRSIVFLEMADIWIPSHHIVGNSQLTLVPSSWIPTTTTRNILAYHRRQGLTLLAYISNAARSRSASYSVSDKILIHYDRAGLGFFSFFS